jgi:hypothetical protein
VADPAGDLGKSLQLGQKSSVQRSITGSVNFRLSVRVWASQTTAPFNINLIGSESTLFTAAFSSSGSFGSTTYTLGEWHLVEILVSTSSKQIQALLDGTTALSESYTGTIDTVQFSAGTSSGATFAIDDFYTVAT